MYKRKQRFLSLCGVKEHRDLTLISHSTPSTDDDQRHAVNTTLHFGRFKITISFSLYHRR